MTRAGSGMRLIVPSIGTAALRLTQLVILVALSRLADAGERNVLVTAFGLLAAVGIISDSGAGNFILANDPKELTRTVFRRVLSVHMITTSLGVVAVLVAMLGLGDDRVSRGGIGVVVALSLTQTFDSLVRVCKAPLLLQGRDGAYGLIDIGSIAAKAPILAAVFLSGQLGWLWLLPLPSLVLIVGLLSTLHPPTGAPDEPLPRLVRRILEIGASGSLTALYSQAPLIIGAATLSIANAATLAAATRIVQAMEFVPATLATQALPRLRRLPRKVLPWWACLVGLGSVMAVLLVAFRPLIERILHMDIEPTIVLIALASALTLKSGNYLLVAGLLARGLARVRLGISAIVGTIAIVGCLVASTHGLAALAGMSIVTEVALMTLSGGALIRRRRAHAVRQEA